MHLFFVVYIFKKMYFFFWYAYVFVYFTISTGDNFFNPITPISTKWSNMLKILHHFLQDIASVFEHSVHYVSWS